VPIEISDRPNNELSALIRRKIGSNHCVSDDSFLRPSVQYVL
jgi:hypothetical protein